MWIFSIIIIKNPIIIDIDNDGTYEAITNNDYTSMVSMSVSFYKYDNGTLLIFLSKSERNFFDIFKATRAKIKEVKNVHIALII